MPRDTPRDRVRARGVAAFVLLGLALALASCGALEGSPPASGRPIGACTTVDATVVRLAWSQRGRFLAVGFVRPDGQPGARVLDGDLTAAGEPAIDPAMLPATAVVSATGQLAWLAGPPEAPTIVEAGPDARRTVAAPAGVLDLQWTAIGYALLQRTPDGRTEVLILDPDRPEAPTVAHRSFLSLERLWVSADPEHLLLSGRRDDGSTGFELVGPTEALLLTDVPGADLTGASMPGLRQHVVYRSTLTGTMVAVVVRDLEDLDAPVVIEDAPARLGVISDLGVLAFVPEASPTSVCRVEVTGRLPVPAPR